MTKCPNYTLSLVNFNWFDCNILHLSYHIQMLVQLAINYVTLLMIETKQEGRRVS